MNGWKECKGFLLGFAGSRTIPEDIFRIGHGHTFSSWVFRKSPRVLVAESLSVVCKGGHSFAPPPGVGGAAYHLFRAVSNRVSAHIPVPTCPGACCGALSYPGVGLPGGGTRYPVRDSDSITNVLAHSRSPKTLFVVGLHSAVGLDPAAPQKASRLTWLESLRGPQAPLSPRGCLGFLAAWWLADGPASARSL